ncbi:BTAD domain-containing putative transcriptional regulator [Embleya sp. NPDC050154]|uniref:AfsR/SARP family transcriptional regulator n=1 Tax=Embleya sp. NPDC050154 TaxID=3363988 RepID=UPI0037BBFAB9
MTPEFGLLGGIEVRVDGTPVDVGHVRQRCVLAVLLVEANRLVPIERIVERVWGHSPPHRARETLYSYLSRLRRRLAVAEVHIARRPGGYLLEADTSAVDLHRFRDLIALARRTDDDGRAASAWAQALDLWRGDAFTTVDTPWFSALREALHRERYQAELDLDDLRLRLGDHAAMLPRLATRARTDPLDERLAGQLMLAQYRNGRPADALAHYQRLRRRLAHELGTDPGRDLRRLHQGILTASPVLAVPAPADAEAPLPTTRTPIPRQLPPAPAVFIGRARALADLDRALGEPRRPGDAVAIAVIGGSGGIGKTWLALHWAHHHADAFPDGQLYVDLRGFVPRGQPVSAGVAVGGFLEALGVDSAAIPPDEAGRAALYRSLIADKRMLIVLDNARDSAQVRPLLPGGPSCAVLVTSRRRLTGLLTAHGGRPLSLEELDPTEARELLRRQLGSAPDAEPDAVAALVEHCAGLPLALGIVAARAAARPGRPLAEAAAELRDRSGRLDALDVDDPTADVRAVFSSSYHALAPATARVFELLAHAPGPDIGVPAAAALTGLTIARARTHLRTLEAAHLVREHVAGRHRLHGLIRLYAIERGRHGSTGQRCEPALHRLVDFYVDTARAADRRLSASRPARSAGRPEAAEPVVFRNAAAAICWFDTEHACLREAHALAIERELPHRAWELALFLDTFHWRLGHLAERREMLRATLAAGVPDDLAARAHAHRLSGRAHVPAGEHTEALRRLREALALSVTIGDEAGRANAHLLLAGAWERQGDHRQALIHAEQGLRIHRAHAQACLRTRGRPADPRGEAAALGAVGRCHARLGHTRFARAYCERALTRCRLHNFPDGEADARESLGGLAEHDGEYALALEHYSRALALRRRLLDAFREADTLARLGEVHLALGRIPQAHDAWRQALGLYRTQRRSESADHLRHRLTDTA